MARDRTWRIWRWELDGSWLMLAGSYETYERATARVVCDTSMWGHQYAVLRAGEVPE